MKVQFSKTDWIRVGKRTGWLKGAMAIEVPGETEKSLARYNTEYIQEALKDFQVIQSYQPKIANALQRYSTIVSSAPTTQKMIGVIPDIVSVLEGIRRLYISFYQGLKGLREKGSLVELNPIIQSLYKTIEEVYRVEENYKTWNNIEGISKENKADFLKRSKSLPEAIRFRNEDILNAVNVVQEQFSKLIPKEEPKLVSAPITITPEVPKPTEVITPEAPKAEVANPVVGQTYENVEHKKVFSIKTVDLEKQEVTIVADGKDVGPIPLKKFNDAIREGKLVLR